MITLEQAYNIAKKSILPDGAYLVGIYEHAHLWSFEFTFAQAPGEPIIGHGIDAILKDSGSVVSVGSGAVPQFFKTNGYGKEVPAKKLRGVMTPEDYKILVDFKKLYRATGDGDEDEDEDDE